MQYQIFDWICYLVGLLQTKSKRPRTTRSKKFTLRFFLYPTIQIFLRKPNRGLKQNIPAEQLLWGRGGGGGHKSRREKTELWFRNGNAPILSDQARVSAATPPRTLLHLLRGEPIRGRLRRREYGREVRERDREAALEDGSLGRVRIADSVWVS